LHEFQWFSVTGADLGRKQCRAGASWECLRGGAVRSLRVRGGNGKDF